MDKGNIKLLKQTISIGDVDNTAETHTHENGVKKYGWEWILSSVIFVEDLNIDSQVGTTTPIIDPANPVRKFSSVICRMAAQWLQIHEAVL